MAFADDDLLMLSGIQHFAFCPRQWALIHLEQQWNENLLTTEGHIMHQHVDDPFYRQKIDNCVCLRSVSLASKELGLYGLSDIVELHQSSTPDNAILHHTYPGYWIPYPVEYKHGKPKKDDIDIAQLTAQAMCLEEQYGITILKGAIFYGETRHREEVEFSDKLRSAVRAYAASMHEIYNSGIIPPAKASSYCSNCSIKDICMPSKNHRGSASNYLEHMLYEKTS